MTTGLNLDTLNGALLYLTAIFGGFLAALWLGLVIWTYRDIRARTQDRLLQVLAALLVALLNIPGVIIYLILRPPRTLDEEYQHTLEEEALLSEIEERLVCPGCGSRTQADWQVCPSCHTRLRRPCAHCGKMMELSWKICPHCATLAPGVRAEPPPLFEPPPG
ncbi:MAG TPA: zinc ribbon domain-containing protein [Anaerolineales bacterium]|nr:zinc ribbon domain-containing protein [Anaerolineales bacterium]